MNRPSTIRSRVADLSVLLLVWAGVALASMLTLWVWPRTLVGLVLCVVFGPVVLLLCHVLHAWIHRVHPLRDFNHRLNLRTAHREISALRIAVYTAEMLLLLAVFTAILVALWSQIPVDPGAAEAFWKRHFWP